jgi:hypothetical protein
MYILRLKHKHLFLVKKNIPRYLFLPETSACGLKYESESE